MKSLEIIIVLCLIIFTYQRCETGTKKEDCKVENLSKTEKERGAKYCCYAEGVINTVCLPLNKYQYENINDYVKTMKLIPLFRGDAKIDCKSLYLGISFLSFLLLLL